MKSLLMMMLVVAARSSLSTNVDNIPGCTPTTLLFNPLAPTFAMVIYKGRNPLGELVGN